MYLIVDVETTGLNLNENDSLNERANVIQFAYAVYNEDKNMVASVNTLIKPEGWVIGEGALRVHGIKQEDCEKLGIPLFNVINMFHNHAKICDFIVAHNLKYDFKLLKFSYERVGMLDEFPVHLKKVCTMECSKHIVKAKTKAGILKFPRLDECVNYFFQRPIKNYHTALTDVLECKNVFFKLNEMNSISINEAIC